MKCPIFSKSRSRRGRLSRLMALGLLVGLMLTLPVQGQEVSFETAQTKLAQLLASLGNLDTEIQQEIEKALTAELDLRPKGEFESTAEYDERLCQNETRRQEIAARYEEQKTERRAILDKELELLTSKAYPTPIQLELGYYRPELERFPFTVPKYQKKGSLLIPKSIAQQFKEGFANLKPIGYFQLSRDGETRLIYVVVEFNGQPYTARTDRRMQSIKNLATFKNHSRSVNAVVFNPDGSLLATGSDDKTVKIWDVKKQTLLYNLTGHTKYVTALAFHPSEPVLASGGSDGLLIIWQIDGQKILQKIMVHPEGIKSLAFSPDGKIVATAAADYKIYLYQVSDATCLQTLSGHTDEIHALTFSPDNLCLVSTGYDQSIRLWSVKDGSNIKTITKAHPLWINAIAYSPDGEQIASAGDDKIVKIWNAKDLSPQKTFSDLPAGVIALAFSNPDGLTIACGLEDNTLLFKRVADGTTLFSNKEHSGTVKSAAYDVQGKLLATASEDRTVRLWEIVYDEMAELAGASDVVRTIAGAANGLPPKLRAEINFSEPSGNNFLDANETGLLKITVINNGQGPGFAVSAVLSGTQNPELDYPPRTLIGDINPGESKTVEIALKARYKMSADSIALNCNIIEANGFNLDPMQIQFETRPYFVNLVNAGIQVTDQSGNGMIEPEEIVEVTVRLQNQGTSVARDVRAALRLGDNVFFVGKDTKERVQQTPIGDLPAGDFRDLTIKVYTNNVATAVPVFLTVSEYYREWGVVNLPVELSFNQRLATMQQFVVKGKEDGSKYVTDGFSIDVELNIPAGQGVKNDAVALIIANRKYQNSDIPEVSFAHRDGEFVKQYLLKTLGFREGNILVYNDATQSQFKTALQKLANTAKDTAEIFFYYVGHGAPDPESKRGYFVPVDCDPNYVSVGGIALDYFYEQLNNIKTAATTVMIDACFSGSSNEGMLIKNVSPVMIEIEKGHTLSDHIVEFTSSSADEVSSWYPEKKHSLYTYYFLRGLQGEADENKDLVLTVGELAKYLDSKVPYEARRLNNRQQTPGVTPDRADRVLVRYGQ